jgi:hypothetical protein
MNKRRTRIRRKKNEKKNNNRWIKEERERKRCRWHIFGTSSDLLPAPGRGAASTCLVIKQMRPRSRQLASQCARLAAEASIVLVRTETRFDDQLAVGEERVVGTVRVEVDTCY